MASSAATATCRWSSAAGTATSCRGTWPGLASALYAWDWESSAPDAPVGFDALHYHFQVAFVARRRPLAEAARRGQPAAPDRPSRRSASAPTGVQLVAALHLVELFVRHEEARSSAGRRR